MAVFSCACDGRLYLWSLVAEHQRGHIHGCNGAGVTPELVVDLMKDSRMIQRGSLVCKWCVSWPEERRRPSLWCKYRRATTSLTHGPRLYELSFNNCAAIGECISRKLRVQKGTPRVHCPCGYAVDSFIRSHLDQAGGKKDANNPPWIPPYSIMNMTMAPPKRCLLLSIRQPATHQYQTG